MISREKAQELAVLAVRLLEKDDCRTFETAVATVCDEGGFNNFEDCQEVAKFADCITRKCPMEKKVVFSKPRETPRKVVAEANRYRQSEEKPHPMRRKTDHIPHPSSEPEVIAAFRESRKDAV